MAKKPDVNPTVFWSKDKNIYTTHWTVSTLPKSVQISVDFLHQAKHICKLVVRKLRVTQQLQPRLEDQSSRHLSHWMKLCLEWFNKKWQHRSLLKLVGLEIAWFGGCRSQMYRQLQWNMTLKTGIPYPSGPALTKTWVIFRLWGCRNLDTWGFWKDPSP